MLKKTVSKSPWMLRLAIVGALLAIIGVILLVRAFQSGVQGATPINAVPSQHIEPFGDDLILYDGALLHRIGQNGVAKWHYQAGQYAGFHVGGKRIVTWSANQLAILDPNSGNAVYQGRMDNMVQFARAGNSYIAILTGDKLGGGTLMLVDNDGKKVDSVAIDETTLTDIGFFTETREMMWVLGVNTMGTVPVNTLQIFNPSEALATPNLTLGEQLAYRVFHHDTLLRVVDTRQIRTYNSQAKELSAYPPVLIYGWYLQDVRLANRVQYQLLMPMSSVDSQAGVSDLRLIYGNVDRVLHLPAACSGVLLGTKAVYAFSGNTVYLCYYGDNTFVPSSLPLQVSKVIGITQNDHAILGDTSQVYIVPLPK